MTQLLLLPDPRPLVERLGAEFFRRAPETPGVYLMRDAAGTVLYVGKAKDLRKRLASYRVANPDRMPRRRLRLLHAAVCIELQKCADEPAALARESQLLRALRPRFNRAGTWAGLPRFLGWRLTEEGLEIAVHPAMQDGWRVHGPMGAGAVPLRAALVRLLWCVIHPERGLSGMPQGWFRGRCGNVATIPRHGAPPAVLEESQAFLAELSSGDPNGFDQWVRERASLQSHPFEKAVREADLETLSEFFASHLRSARF